MSTIEWTFASLAVVGSLASIGILLKRNAYRTDFDARQRDDYVGDIRAMNTYNSYFMTAILVFFGFVFGGTNGGINNDLPHSALMMLSLAFLASAGAMYYVPVRKIQVHGNENDRLSIRGMHSRWLAAIICSQLTIILSVCGVLSIVGTHFANDRERNRASDSGIHTSPAIVPSTSTQPASAEKGSAEVGHYVHNGS